MSPVMSPVMTSAAFGDEPGRWPLPEPCGPEELWLRAVAAGGQGRYARARADLAELARTQRPGRLMSLALSTRASFLRQLGWHWSARDGDGLAWAGAGGDPEAGVDALAGLAADALGVGRLALSSTLLSQAVDLHSRAEAPPPRQAIRLAWVGAELAMAAGDGGAAVVHARRARELAGASLPVLRRHRVKSDVVLAAALCCAGDLPAARALADSALADAGAYGLVPLRWALSRLLGDIGSVVHSPAQIEEIRHRSAAFVIRHGGRWNGR